MSFRSRSLTETKMPRAITSRWILENQISTWLSQEELVCNGCEHYDFAPGIPRPWRYDEPRDYRHRIQPIQCLNGTCRVDAEHRCIDRRLEIQTDDIGGFFLELRIITGNIAAQSMRLEPSFSQDARYPDVVGSHFGGNLASRPMRRAINRFALGQSQHFGLESNAFFAATPSTMPAV